MPAKSKQQQKFMGLVHAYKKGEVPASKVSKSVKDAAKSMSNKSVKKYAKTKHDELPKKVTEKKERDYKAEYKKFQSSTKAKKYRAELNKYNRQKGTYGNGDGKDASHKGGKIVGFEAQSKNRGRREKSRLKKESAFSVKIDTFQNAMKSLDKLSDILKKGGEKKKSMMVSKLIKQLQQAFFRKEIVENITEDITKLEKLAMNLLRNINKNAGVKNYDHTKTADFNKVVKFLKGKMPKVPNQRIGQIAMSYDKYRQKQPKIRIPDIDSVKDMENTLKKLGMKEGINEREMSIKDAFKDLVKDHGAKKALDMLADVLTGGALATMDDKKVKAFKKKLLKKVTTESINEEQYFNPKGEFKKYMDKVFKQAGIRVIKFDPMKESFFNGAWGGFYTVKSSNKIDIGGKPVTRGSAVLPVYISRVGEIQLGVSAKGFHLGRAGSSRVVKNLIDFRKEDLGESVNEIVYQFKGYTNTQMDELDAMLARAGVKGTPDFNKMTYTTNKISKNLDKIVKSKGGKKIKEGTCGYGLDGNLGEEPAGPHLMKKIKKITKDKEKLKEDIEMSKGVKKLMKIADEGFGKVGGTTVDSMSAGLFKQIYNKVNDDIKKQLNTKNEKQLVRIIGGMWKKFGKNVSIGSSL